MLRRHADTSAAAMTWGHKHKPQDQLQGQYPANPLPISPPPQQQQLGLQMPPQAPLQASTPQEAENLKKAHWQARLDHHPVVITLPRLGT